MRSLRLLLAVGLGLAPTLAATAAGTTPAFAGGGAGMSLTATMDGQDQRLLAGTKHTVQITVADTPGEADLRDVLITLHDLDPQPLAVTCAGGQNGQLSLEPEQSVHCTAVVTARVGYRTLVARATANVPGEGSILRTDPLHYDGFLPPPPPPVKTAPLPAHAPLAPDPAAGQTRPVVFPPPPPHFDPPMRVDPPGMPGSAAGTGPVNGPGPGGGCPGGGGSGSGGAAGGCCSAATDGCCSGSAAGSSAANDCCSGGATGSSAGDGCCSGSAAGSSAAKGCCDTSQAGGHHQCCDWSAKAGMGSAGCCPDHRSAANGTRCCGSADRSGACDKHEGGLAFTGMSTPMLTAAGAGGLLFVAGGFVLIRKFARR
jgi:hypothetical protein